MRVSHIFLSTGNVHTNRNNSGSGHLETISSSSQDIQSLVVLLIAVLTLKSAHYIFHARLLVLSWSFWDSGYFFFNVIVELGDDKKTVQVLVNTEVTRTCKLFNTLNVIYLSVSGAFRVSTLTAVSVVFPPPSRCQNHSTCKLHFNGQGYQYQALAGPIFIIGHTLGVVPISFAAKACAYSRRMLLCAWAVFWSGLAILTGFARTYWQLVVVRFGFGIGWGMLKQCQPLSCYSAS